MDRVKFSDLNRKVFSQTVDLFQKLLARPGVFFSSIFFLTFLQARFFFSILSLEPGNVYSVLWALSFLMLAPNISILATQAIFASFVKSLEFRRVDSSKVTSLPVALLYCIKNESFGLQERIRYTLRGNLLPGVDLWILSDSETSAISREQTLVQELRNQFDAQKIFYRHRREPQERKQGNIKDWLHRFSAPYRYFVICDADSLLPQGWLEEALRIAEHPDHAKIAVFQSAIYITHEDSLYSQMLAWGQFYAQQLYFRTNQAVLGRSIAFGHNCLTRTEAFAKIELPQGILSHDTWETPLLEREGYRTVFLDRLRSYEEAPAHYLEARRRVKRWHKGSLQAVPILFLPGISLATRFLVFYQIYLYLVPPVLCLLIVSGLASSASMGQPLFVTGEGSLSLLGVTLFVLYFHKFVVARNWGDAKRLIQETLLSSLLALQDIFYGTLDFILLPFQKMSWVPMEKNPGERPHFSECARELLLGSAAGALAFWVGIRESPSWALFTLPVLISLVFSIPSVYLSSRNLLWKGGQVPWRLKTTRWRTRRLKP